METIPELGSQRTINEERRLMNALIAMFDKGLPQEYIRPIPDFFHVNRWDMLNYPNRLVMVDIGNTSAYDPMPDHLNYEAGGLSIKTITVRIYLFINVLNINNVNVGKPTPKDSEAVGNLKEPGILDAEQEVYDVLNAEPFLTIPDILLRWKIASVDRDAWKQLETLVGSTITLSVEVGERDRINP